MSTLSVENRLQRSLDDVFQMIERTHFLLNTIINSCNGTKGVSFTSAEVVLQDELDVISDCLSGLESRETERNVILPFKDVLNIELLSSIFNFGVGEVQEEYRNVFQSLFEFVQNIDKHEEALTSIKGSTDADAMVIMGLHLFSQLIPCSEHSIEMDATKFRSNKCFCKERCDRTIDLTCTAIGSPFTWHGYADIILNKQIPIVFLEKKRRKSKEDVFESCEEPEDCEGQGPSSRKKKRYEDSDLTTDKKHNIQDSQRSSFLLDDKIIGQLIAQTVTNAFIQVKKNELLSGHLIPLFGCSSEEVYFFMYDPVNDILFRSSHVINLFLPLTEKLDLKAIIIIWIFLNFTTFVRPNIANEYELKESNFHSLVRNCLCKYKEGTFKQEFKTGQSSLVPEALLNILVERGKLAEKK